MLPIIICEDNDIQREKIKNFIELAIAKWNFDFEISLCTGKVEELLSFLDEQRELKAIYFLDVDLKNEINGIMLAEHIRKKDSSGYIIFITTHSEMSHLTFKYKVEAMDYIIKDNYSEIKSRIEQCLNYINKTYYTSALKGQVLTFKQDDRVFNIALNDILFIESSPNPHKIIIHEETRLVEVYGSLKDLEDKLTKDFFRCHRAYFVNKRKIKEIDKRNRIIYMTNGEKCLASFRCIGGLLDDAF